MHQYQQRTFSIPEIVGISKKQIDEHIKLYGGYVTHVNKIYAELEELEKDAEKNGHLMQELRRRLGFEFNGMRLHEYYFGDMEDGAQPPNKESALSEALEAQFGSLDTWKNSFKKIAARGSGWMILNYDPTVKTFHNNWVTNHDEGQMATLPAIIALDFWEHAYMVDYVPGDKMKYLEAYLNALNWKTIENRFERVR
jgi:superoxide dismutase, Fe-Mn family